MRLLRISLVCLGILFLWFCILHFGLSDPRGEGKALRATLATGFANADRVEVIVHSDRADFSPVESEARYERIEYERIELSKKQRSWFIEHIPSATSRTVIMGGMVKSLCGFRPHHTFSFLRGDSEIARVEVCFLCDSASRGGEEGWASWHGVEVLREGLNFAGLDTDRDWSALVRQSREGG
jgi:hypothetical protein